VYIRQKGIIMQQTASQGKAKSTALVAGLGAAFVASAITLTMMSNPSPAVPDQAATTTATPQCKVVQREFLVSTTAGSGTVRLREGNYLSPPITLSTQRQSVVFPVPRPETTPEEKVITIEGNATDVVLTSPVTDWKHEFPNVTGVVAFTANWMPMKRC
jgi:hypothetical protein